MRTTPAGDRGLRLLLDLHADTFLYIATIAAALGLGTLMSTLATPSF